MVDRFKVDRTTGEVSAYDFDALLLPGGVANPDRLRTDANAVALVRDMFLAGMPVAAICHGPTLDAHRGRGRQGSHIDLVPLHTDVDNAGGSWVDEEVVDARVGPIPSLPVASRMTSRRFASSSARRLARRGRRPNELANPIISGREVTGTSAHP
jgi:putative intracellular protease/amidase